MVTKHNDNSSANDERIPCWIMTNYGDGENYTPSCFKTEEAARKWMRELAAEDIKCAYPTEIEKILSDEIERLNIDENDIAEETKIEIILDNPVDDVEVFDSHIVIGDPDNGGNIIQIFATEICED